MKKVRKPIQIAALRFGKPVEASGGQDSIETEVVALCDDGSIWTILGDDNEWVPLPPIPQGQLREDWLAEVGEMLTSNHLVRRDAVTWILNEYRDELRLAFNSHDSTKDAAKAIYAKLQAKQ
jgi:hypothetical protein